MKVRGFTLIELLIVIAILAILSTLGMNNFRSSRIKATDLARKSDLQAIAKSLEAYANDHRAYPLSDSNGKIICQPPNGICNWGSPLTDGNTLYVTSLPGNSGSTLYNYDSDGKTYTIYTYLENTQDPSIITLDPNIAAKCGSLTPCNYKITSTNQ